MLVTKLEFEKENSLVFIVPVFYAVYERDEKSLTLGITFLSYSIILSINPKP